MNEKKNCSHIHHLIFKPTSFPPPSSQGNKGHYLPLGDVSMAKQEVHLSFPIHGANSLPPGSGRSAGIPLLRCAGGTQKGMDLPPLTEGSKQTVPLFFRQGSVSGSI